MLLKKISFLALLATASFIKPDKSDVPGAPRNKHLKVAGDVVEIAKEIIKVVEPIAGSIPGGAGDKIQDAIKPIKNIINNLDPLFDKFAQFLVNVERAKEAGRDLEITTKCSFKPNSKEEFLQYCFVRSVKNDESKTKKKERK